MPSFLQCGFILHDGLHLTATVYCYNCGVIRVFMVVGYNEGYAQALNLPMP